MLRGANRSTSMSGLSGATIPRDQSTQRIRFHLRSGMVLVSAQAVYRCLRSLDLCSERLLVSTDNFYTHRDQAGLVCNSYDTYNWGMGAEGTSSGQPCGYAEGTGNIATGPAWPYEWDEVGACGMCSLEQLDRIIPDESVRWPINGSNPNSAAWHWHAAFGVQRNDTWLSPSSYRWLFTPPRGPNGTWAEPLPSLKDEFEASQFLQAEAYRYIFQSNRRARWHRSAVAIWTLNEPFPNAGKYTSNHSWINQALEFV